MMRARTLHVWAIVSIVLPQPIAPATIIVDGGTGAVAADGVCTLPEALDNANDDLATHVDCAAGSGVDDILLTTDITLTERNNGPAGAGNGLPVVTSHVIIDGNGHTVHRDPASEAFRILELRGPGRVRLEDATVSGGRIASPTGASIGGGILNDGGTLTLLHATVTGNRAVASATPAAYGGGLYNTGVTRIERSTVSSNVVESIEIAGGAAIVRGGGLANCALDCPASAGPQVVLVGSTVSGNSASSVVPDGASDAAYAYGAGIYNGLGSMSITNSTVSGNYGMAEGGFGLVFGSGISTADGDLFLVNTTIAGNSASDPFAAALDYFGFGTGPTIEIEQTILGAQVSGYNCFGIDGYAVDLGDNLDDDGSCGAGFDALGGLDTMLADNGGPTATHALLAGSSAIDTGACDPTVRQRGVRDDPVHRSGGRGRSRRRDHR